MFYPRIIHANTDACTGCKMCEMVCSLIHSNTGINPKHSRIKISENIDKGVFIPLICHFCEDASCIEVCPKSALSKDKKTNAILVDEENCTSCGLCCKECKYDAIFLHPEKNIVCVCDLCNGRPKCVEYCLQNALVFEQSKRQGSKNTRNSD
ncbi:4Fe-4S dicluster domain-containing protein [Actinomycetota bacterium]